MMVKLNVHDRFEERKFIITSIIRLMGMCNFSCESVAQMIGASDELRRIEEKGAVVTDEQLFKLYDGCGNMGIVKDFVHYMDTTYPKDVNREKYTDLKYMNRDIVDTFLSTHQKYDKMLLEKVAVKEFMEQSIEDIQGKLDEYMEE